MSKTKEYTKLPGRGTRFEGARLIAGVRKSCTMWLAADHVLLILSSHFVQEFKRFYFRDIQSIHVRKTQRARAWSIALGFLAVVFALIAVAARSEPIAFWALVSFAGFFAVITLANILSGPSCLVELRTAVQTEELSSLKRLRTARKTLAILRPLIEQAQGTMSPAEIESATVLLFQKANNVRGGIGGHPSISYAANSCSGRVHQWLFGVLLCVGLIHLLMLVFHPIALLIFTTLLSLAATALVVMALIKQHQTDLWDGIRRLTWVVAGYVLVGYFASVVINGVVSSSDPEAMQNEWMLLQHLAEMNPLETPWLLILLLTTATCSLVLGSLGLVWTKRFRAQKQTAAVPPVLNPNIPAAP